MSQKRFTSGSWRTYYITLRVSLHPGVVNSNCYVTKCPITKYDTINGIEGLRNSVNLLHNCKSCIFCEATSMKLNFESFALNG